MKPSLFFILKFIFIFTPLLFAQNQELSPPCRGELGIKKTITITTNSEEIIPQKIQIIKYDTLGRPTLRRDSQNTEFMNFYYTNKNLTLWTITRKHESKTKYYQQTNDNYYISTDTGFVEKNDVFGRPLVIKGSDKNVLYYTYEGCKQETQTLKSPNDELIHQHTTIYQGKIPIKSKFTILTPEEEIIILDYKDYKFDQKGNWIERKYQYPSGGQIHQIRKITYY